MLTCSFSQTLVSAAAGRPIRYEEAPLPPGADMAGLWAFLRAGGFHTPPAVAVGGGAVLEVARRPPIDVASWLAKLPLTAAPARENS